MTPRKYLYNACLFLLLLFSTGCAHFPGQSNRVYWGKVVPIRPQGKAYAHHIAGVLYERQGKFAEALESWKSVLAFAPEAHAPRLRMIRLYLTQGDLNQAIATGEEVLRYSPEVVEFWVIQGEMKQAAGDFDGARDCFEKAIALKPDNMLGYSALADLYEKTNDLVAAIELYEKLIQNSPDSAALYFQLGMNLTKINDNAGACAAFTRVLELEPLVTQARLMQAIHLSNLHRFNESKDAFYLYLAERPNDIQALQYLVGTMLHLRRMEEARSIMHRLLENQEAGAKNVLQWALVQGLEMNFSGAAQSALEGNAPFLASCYGRLANAAPNEYSGQDKVFLSLEEIELECSRIEDALISLQAPPQLADALCSQMAFFQESPSIGRFTAFLQARLLLYLKRPREALDLLNQIQADGEAQKFVLYHQAIASEALKDMESTEKHLLAYLFLDSQNATMLNFLGYLYAEENRNLGKALKLLTLALSLSPDDPFYLDSLGWIHYRLGNFDQAAELVRKAIYGMETDDAVLRRHLGDIYEAQGNTQAALEQWRRALRLDPAQDDLRKKMEHYQPAN